MSNKVKLIISGILFIVFCVALYSTLKNKPKNRNVKQPRSITLKQCENGEGFNVYILINGEVYGRELIKVHFYYDGRLIKALDTYVCNKFELIDEGYFEVEYYYDYVKLNILDCDGKITGVFRAYIDTEKHSENDAFKERE
ncbi:MAG: hypothetical protein IIY49_06610 [Eubacterium sp.]|nr:hypothetical protein [Eubacterium sp.]